MKHKQNNITQLAQGLYIVATPLGNARDITLRALDVLGGVDVIFCEDTRITRKLMQIYSLTTPLKAYHEHNAPRAGAAVLRYLQQGKTVALVSDAGTPLISDPGYRLVRKVRAAGFDIFTLPGASAPIAALSISGLASDRFYFLGFLPAKKAARITSLSQIPKICGTVIIFESPMRIAATLADIAFVFGDIDIVVARELTKKFEEIKSAPASVLAQNYRQNPPKGEFVLMFSLAAEAETMDAAALDVALQAALKTQSLRDAAQEVAAKFDLNKRMIYARALALRDAAKEKI